MKKELKNKIQEKENKILPRNQNIKDMNDVLSTIVENTDLDPKKIRDNITPRKYVIKRLNRSFNQDETIDYLIEYYGMSKTAAEKLIRETRKHLQKIYKNYSDDIAKRNMIVLQEILEEALESKSYGTAIDCIRELNKMSGVYQQNQVTIANDSSGNQIINVTFD